MNQLLTSMYLQIQLPCDTISDEPINSDSSDNSDISDNSDSEEEEDLQLRLRYLRSATNEPAPIPITPTAQLPTTSKLSTTSAEELDYATLQTLTSIPQATQPSTSASAAAQDLEWNILINETSLNPIRACRGITGVVLDDESDDESVREPGWLCRDQIDYESLAESNKRHNEFEITLLIKSHIK